MPTLQQGTKSCSATRSGTKGEIVSKLHGWGRQSRDIAVKGSPELSAVQEPGERSPSCHKATHRSC